MKLINCIIYSETGRQICCKKCICSSGMFAFSLSIIVSGFLPNCFSKSPCLKNSSYINTATPRVILHCYKRLS